MKVLVSGIATEYQDQGTGPIVLFLPGWQDTLHSFDAIAKDLIPNYRIIRLDLPGFGATETPAEPWDLDCYITFVAEFIKKLTIVPTAIVGHSFGGRITIKGLATQTLAAEKIILIAAAGITHRRTWRNTILQALAKTGRLLTTIPPLSFWRQTLRKKLYRAIGSDYFAAGRLKETFLKVIAEDLSQVAPKIAVPTLLIWGADDTATPLTDGQKLHQLISGSKLEVITNTGHFVHQQEPERVAILMKNFLC